jgi:hypothetical protein
MDLNLIKFIIQVGITALFFILAGIGLIQKDLNFGFAMNLVLGFLYLVLYFHPLP